VWGWKKSCPHAVMTKVSWAAGEGLRGQTVGAHEREPPAPSPPLSGLRQRRPPLASAAAALGDVLLIIIPLDKGSSALRSFHGVHIGGNHWLVVGMYGGLEIFQIVSFSVLPSKG